MSQPRRFAGFMLLWLMIGFEGWGQPNAIQSGATRSDVPDLHFTHYFEKFSITNISSIVQDTSGFIWIGTVAGLNRFDGQDFHTFESSQSDTTSVTDNRINDLLIDKSGRLWIATYQDLMWFDEANYTFRVVDRLRDPDLEIDALTLEEAKDGTFWIGTLHGLYQTDDLRGYLKRPDPHFSFLENQQVNDLFIEDSENMWIGTERQLIWTDQEHYRVLIDDVQVTSIAQWKSWVWVGTRAQGLFKLAKDGHVVDHYELADAANEGNINRIFDIHPDDQGRLWVGTEIGGLQLYQSEEDAFYPYTKGLDEGSLKSNSVWEVFQDHSGRLWLGTNNQGVFVNDPNHSKFDRITPTRGQTQQLKFGTVSSFLPVEHGLWIGTDGGGISVYDSLTRSFTFFDKSSAGGKLGSDEVLSFYRDSEGIIWVGNWGGGLNRYDRFTRNFQTFVHDENNPRSIGSNNVFAIREDLKGNLWCTTWGKGLSRLDKSSGHFSHIGYESHNTDYLSSDLTYDLEIDSSGNLWVATVLGLDKVTFIKDTFQVSHFTHRKDDPTSLSSLNVNSIFIDSKGRVWIGTKYGLNILLPGTDGFERIFKEDGLSDNDIKSVTEDDFGNFWVATGNGLTRMTEERGVWSYQLYDESDGILSREFFNNASLNNADGKIFLGGLNGFNHFYPDQVLLDRNPPKVQFTQLRIFNSPVIPGTNESLQYHLNQTQKFSLNHKQSVFTIDYLAIHFTHAEKNQFAYQLEGLESHWNYVGALKQATYTNLDPGLYTFKVKAANHDGYWGKERQLLIEVLPPWWETFWFRFLGSFAIISIVLSAFLFRVNFLKGQRAKLQREVDSQTKELKLTNQELQRLGTFKEAITGMLVHDLKNPLHLILGLSDQSKQQDMKEINLSGRRMLYMISNMLDIQKFEETTMKLDESVFDLFSLVEDTRSQFELILKSKSLIFVNKVESIQALGDRELLSRVLQNLISNAAKYTDYGGTITISTKEEKERIIVEISDTGVGIDKKDQDLVFEKFHQIDPKKLGDTSSTGLGLTFCKMAINAHGGEIGVHSEKGKGATFFFDIAKAITNSKSVYNPTPNSKDSDLSEDELAVIRTITEELASLKLYEVSKIEALVNRIEDTEQIRQWKTDLKTAAYHWDEVRFRELTEI